jgi:ElaB/YqjD/DUF883 family membrane-anchored ribosome-binding protein
MVTTTKVNDTETELKKEFDELKKQVATMTELLANKGEKDKADIKHKIKDNFDEYSAKAKEHFLHAQEIGSESMEKVTTKVKQNPYASLLVAFGAGYLISKALPTNE